jgi:glycosyltransferase involved in cell wall biosynthesis
LVFPTHTDTWGLVVNEAMACGLPVISSSAAGCAADLIESGWNGRVADVGESGQLASAMEELARNAALRSLMSQRSTQRIAHYSPDAWAAGMAQVAFSQRRRAA